MMIFRLSQKVNNGYDTFSEAVVIAADAETARRTHPDGHTVWSPELGWDERDDWAPKLEDIKVELIGVATGDAKPGVVCASFHAG
jgi:hypothetical protein